MSVARFIADQRTFYRVPHAFSCRLLEVSEAWFYKWIKAPTTARGRRRELLDEAVRKAFAASGASYGSPRVSEYLVDPELPHPELAGDARPVVELHAPAAAALLAEAVDEQPAGVGDQLPAELSAELPSGVAWQVSVNTVADSMRRQGLMGRKVKRNRGLTRQDRTAPKFPDLLRRDFTAAAINVRWVGDLTEIPTGEGKLYLASVIDLCSRRLLAAPISDHPNT